LQQHVHRAAAGCNGGILAGAVRSKGGKLRGRFLPRQHFCSKLLHPVFHDAAAHAADGPAIGQKQHFGADFAGGRAVARNDGGKDGGRIQRPQRCQNRRGKALGQRAGALDLNDLGQNGQRDLLRRLGPNSKADGRVERFHPCGVEPGFDQLAAHQRGTAPAAHHTDIRGGLLQNSGQALQVAVVRAGDHHKIAFRTAGNFGKALRKGGAKHFLRPGVPQIVGKIRPVLQRTNGQPQKPCQPHHRSAHMAAAADHKLRGCAKALHKDALSG